MHWYALTHIGAEDALKNELSTHGITAETREGACAFTASQELAATILYRLQTATRLLLALDEGSYAELTPARAETHIPEGETFCIRGEILSGTERTAGELAAELGKHISRPVDLEEPAYTIWFQHGKHCLLGIDIAGDLSKRYYRVFGNAHSVKGTFAAALLWSHKTDGGILDPFANTGEVAIEAALRATNTSPLKYRKHQRISILDEYRSTWKDEPRAPKHPIWCLDSNLGALRSCEKNAKLAGVKEAITFSKLDPEWMDVKFSEGEIGAIITIPPPITTRNPEDTHLRELCYQAKYVLGTGGKLIVACETPATTEALKRYANEYKLQQAATYTLHSGKLGYDVIAYEL